MKKKILAALSAAMLMGTLAFAAGPAEVVMSQPEQFTDADGSSLEVTYPQVQISGNSTATQNIQQYYNDEQGKTKDFFAKQQAKGVVTETKSYEVTCNNGKYLSIVESGKVRFGKEKYPTYWKTGSTFDLDTGKKVTWQEILKPGDEKYFTLKKINQALFMSKYKLSSYFNGLTELPENYYLDKKGGIHFLFGLYEVAPYGTGIVDLDMLHKAR